MGKAISPTAARTWTVALDGTGDFLSIQGAIGAASDGDTIRVYKGTYLENVVIGKRLEMIGNGTDQTIVDGNRADHRDTISITADHVNLSGVQARNAYIGHEFAGIGIRSSHNRISETRCLDNDYGILIIGGSNNIVRDNNASNNNRNGLHMRFTSDNRVDGNTFSSSQTTQGIYLEGGSGNIISNNTCCWNYKYGISLYSTMDNSVVNNTCCHNSLFSGLSVYSSNGNEISDNNCSDNGQFGISIYSSSENLVSRNLIRSNIEGIRASGTSGCEVHLNRIERNRHLGVNVTAHTGPDLNCTSNWWGNESGPYHPSLNPYGTGDNVSDQVDFIPWTNMSIVNRAPMIRTNDVNWAIEDQRYLVVYAAIDPDDDHLTWSFWTDAPWLSWDPGSLSVTGTPTNGFVRNWTVRIDVTDGHGGRDGHLFELQVTNIPPSITTYDRTYIYQGDLYLIDYNSTDDHQGNISWSLQSTDSWLTIDTMTGILSGRPENDDVGTSFVEVSVLDGNGGSDTHGFELEVIDVNDPPSKGHIPEVIEWEEDLQTSIDLAEWFSDPDGDDLTFQIDVSSNITLIEEEGGRVILGSADDWSGNGSLRVICQDPEFSIEATIEVRVSPLNDAPFGANITISDNVVIENRSVMLAGSAEDPDLGYGDLLTFDWSSNITGHLGNGPNITVRLPAGTHRLTLNVSDSEGLSVSTWRILVVKHVPSNDTGPDDNGTDGNGTDDDGWPPADDDDLPPEDDDGTSDDDLPPSGDDDGTGGKVAIVLLAIVSTITIAFLATISVMVFLRARRDSLAELWEE